MNTIIYAVLIFLDILTYLIIFDIILSWLFLFGVKWRPQFLASIIDPIYNFVRKYLPTRIGIFDLTPIVVFMMIYFIVGIIYNIYPDILEQQRAMLESLKQ